MHPGVDGGLSMLRAGALVVVLSAPSVAWAQAPDPESAPTKPAAQVSAEAKTAAPPAPSAPAAPSVSNDNCTVLPQPGSECALSPGRATVIRVARIGVEMVLGTLLGAGLGSLGAYAGLNADLAAGNESGVGLALGTSFGVALGVGPGVWLGGRAMGGDGSFGWSLLGSAVGAGISAGILAVDSSPGMLFIGATIPVALSILAFELSAHTKKPAPAPASKPAAARLAPSIGPRFVGVVGTF